MLANRKSKHYITFLSLMIGTIFLSPNNAYAEWYWMTVISDPNTGYFIEEVSPNTIGYTPTETTDPYSNKTLVPDNFMDTIEETEDSDKCSGELDSAIQKLRQFDANEEIVTPSKCGSECGPYYANPEQTMTAREQLLLMLESDAQSCLADEQKEIEEAIKEQERKEAEEARIVEVQKAVSECDFDYFENEMTNDERMDTWEQREECKTKDVKEVVTEIKPVQPVITPTQTIPPVVQNPVVTPITYTPPTDEKDAEEVSEQTEPETLVVTTSSETETKAESESEEVDIVPTPEEKQEEPSFFQKVVQFFTGWFK